MNQPSQFPIPDPEKIAQIFADLFAGALDTEPTEYETPQEAMDWICVEEESDKQSMRRITFWVVLAFEIFLVLTQIIVGYLTASGFWDVSKIQWIISTFFLSTGSQIWALGRFIMNYLYSSPPAHAMVTHSLPVLGEE